MPGWLSRPALGLLIIVALLAGAAGWLASLRLRGPSPRPVQLATGSLGPIPDNTPADQPDRSATSVLAHNLLLRKGPNFRIYVRWLRGRMARTRREIDPSFDDPDSFWLDIDTGVLRANIGDIANYLNTIVTHESPLQKIGLSGDGDRIRLTGTLHKWIRLPVELVGTLAPLPDGKIQIHVTKLNVLRLPLKGLLGGLNVRVSDFFHSGTLPGVQVTDNDIVLDTRVLLPPPHIRGRLTKVHVVNPDLEEIYGDGKGAEARVEQWRNFIQLRGGTLGFGRLTMHHVDMVMIDVSNDAWFDLDLVNYQTQLVHGYTRMTPTAGLQIFMPDLSHLPLRQADPNISIEWLKHRNESPPPDVIKRTSAPRR